tara:strand:+ start:4631 stop:5611 length:981 start_codon:yes stop_codon:yes gene_type:complete
MIEKPITLIVKSDENAQEYLKFFTRSFESILNHYKCSPQKFLENIGPNEFKFVYISTAGRCGTWWHKYFFKFYADSVAQYPLHIGIRLRNPLTCQALKTLFFVGHMCSPLERHPNGETNNFFVKNGARVARINPAFFNNHATCLQLIKVIVEKFDRYVFNRFYYIYRNVFDQFISMFLMGNRNKKNSQNLSLFEYTKRFLLEPFAFQFLSYQWVQERSPGLVKIHRFDDILKDQKKYFRQLLMDFNVPIHEEALSMATFLASKKFLDYYENSTGLSINESVNKDQVKHISTKEEKQGVEFTKSEKEFIKDYLINYGLNRKFFPEFN